MSAAFDAVFGVFVVLMVGLVVVSVRWAVRRDRVARADRAAVAEGRGNGERRTGDPTSTGPPRAGRST